MSSSAPPPRQRPVAEPAADARDTFAPPPERLHVVNLAEPTLRHQMPGALRGTVESLVHADHEYAVRVARSRRDRFRGREIERKGLVEKRVLARDERRARERRVIEVRHGDVNGVHVGIREQLLRVRVRPFDRIRRRERSQPLRVRIGCGDDRRLRMARDLAARQATDRTGADDAESNTLHDSSTRSRDERHGMRHARASEDARSP
jgi:hypothetical protein